MFSSYCRSTTLLCFIFAALAATSPAHGMKAVVPSDQNDAIVSVEHQSVGPSKVRSLRTRLLSESGDGDSDGDNEEGSTDNANSGDEEGSTDNNDSGDDEESSDDEISGPTKRECEMSQDTIEVEFECKSETEDGDIEIEDEIKFRIRTDGTLQVDIEYEQEVEDDAADTETETETKFDIRFDRIIEYRKASATAASSLSAEGTADMAYEWGVDSIVQTLPLQSFQPIQPVTVNGDLSTFSVTTTDGVVTFTFTVAQSDTGTASANKMKIDVDIANFPWGEDDTYVALICVVESEREVEVEYDDDEGDGGDEESVNNEQTLSSSVARATRDVKISFDDILDTVGFTPFGEYTWAETAEALPAEGNETLVGMPGDDVATTVRVIATTPSASGNGQSEDIAFSFVGTASQGAVDIFWDPEAGVGYNSQRSSAGGMMSIVSGGLWSSMVVLGTMAVYLL